MQKLLTPPPPIVFFSVLGSAFVRLNIFFTNHKRKTTPKKKKCQLHSLMRSTCVASICLYFHFNWMECKEHNLHVFMQVWTLYHVKLTQSTVLEPVYFDFWSIMPSFPNLLLLTSFINILPNVWKSGTHFCVMMSSRTNLLPPVALSLMWRAVMPISLHLAATSWAANMAAYGEAWYKNSAWHD